MTPTDLDRLSPFALFDLLRERGKPIDPGWLQNREYLGVALGSPAWFDRFAWKTFKKVFRQREDGSLHGWNVAVHQDGVREPYRDRTHRGKRVGYWFYEVQASEGYPEVSDFENALVIDYGRGGNRRRNPIRWCRDPLVSLDDERLLLGYSYVRIGRRRLDTPSFFCLSRGKPLEYVLAPPRPPQRPSRGTALSP